MSSIVGAVTGGGDSGVNFRAKQADLIQAATKEQADEQYKNAQTGLQGQQSFLQALQGQNGIQNQSNVFNQMQGVANGTGPNPAQNMLNQATANNTANQTAMMAGQRGSSSNPALIARQAAMQGAANQQNAAGQAATLQAQQSLGALNQMGGIAGQQVGNQANATNAYSQSAQGEQGNILNAINGLNTNNVAMTSNMNTANASLANTVAKQQGQTTGNLMGGIGSAMQLIPGSFGGGLKSTQVGGALAGGAGDAMGAGALSDVMAEAGPAMLLAAEGGQIPSKGPRSKVGQHFANGGQVQAMVSPGEKYLNPRDVQQVAKGASPMAVGEKIPGKPVVGGAKNSYANDIVPKKLDSGGIVLPRSVTQSPDAAKKAAKFVEAILAKNKLKK